MLDVGGYAGIKAVTLAKKNVNKIHEYIMHFVVITTTHCSMVVRKYVGIKKSRFLAGIFFVLVVGLYEIRTWFLNQPALVVV